jgi:hypothetical protein
MPFIVTTKRPEIYEEDYSGPSWSSPCEFRVAVATLDKAREWAHGRIANAADHYEGLIGPAWPKTHHWLDDHLTESGGTVTLPDGSVIEVKPTTWADLASEAGVDSAVRNRAVNGDRAMQQHILDAWNAQEAKR